MNTFKKIKPYLINIIIVISIFILVLILNHISPFGDKLLGNYDAIYQYKPMLFEMTRKIQDGNFLNYTFNNGLGAPRIFVYSYYLSSPLNLVAVLFKTPDSMLLSTIIVKLLVGTIFMTYYAKSKTDKTYIIVIATISYMFSSFLIAYYSFITWLDIIILFPLFQKGLEDLLDKKKPNLYIFSLAMITLCNFFLAFIIYIYTIIYFVVYKLFYKKEPKKEKIDSFNRITIYTILTFVMIFVWVYILSEIFVKTGVTNYSEIDTNYVIKFTDLIRSLLYGNINVASGYEGNTFPNIACNHLILMNIIYYFINNKIPKRNKLFALITILIILATLYIKPFDYVINMFHSVRGFPYRYSFIISFLSILLMIENLKTFTKEDSKKILLSIPVIAIFILITFKGTDKEIIISNIVFMLALSVLFLFYSNNKYHQLLLCSIVIIESFTITYMMLPADKDKEVIDLSLYNKETTKYRNNYALSENEYINNNLYYNKKVTYQFSSLSYNMANKAASNLGCDFYNSVLICTDNNQITNMLLNIDNDYYLEKVFAVDKIITLVDTGNENDIKTNMENAIYGMTGIKDIFDKTILNAEEKDDLYYFKTDYDFYLIERETEDLGIATFPQTYTDFNQNKKYGKNTATIYTLNEDKIKDIYNYLSKNQIQYTNYSENKIEGTIHVDNNQMIYTSIPYDKAWIIKIDGKKIKEPILLMNAFIGIEVEPGDHTISMEYKNTNFIGPFVISLLTTIIYIFLEITKKKKEDN